MRNWEELTELEQLTQIYSDQYKDEYGIRPRGESGHPQTVEEYKTELDRLGEIIHEQIKEDKRRESIAFGEWKVNIRNIMNICSCSKADAIKHDIVAHDIMDERVHSLKKYPGMLSHIVEEYIWNIGIGWDKQRELEGIINAS